MKDRPADREVLHAHALVQVLGRERGLQRASADGLDERLIRILEDFYTSPSGELGIQFSGWSFLSLPHKALPPGQRWERTLQTDGFSCSLIVEPGELMMDGRPKSFGVPFGPTARVILLFLQTQALEQRSREIEVGSTTYAWLRRLGLGAGGQDYRRFREQMLRLLACSVRFLFENRREDGGRVTGFTKNPLIESGIVSHHDRRSDAQMSLWGDRIILSESFYKTLIEHPVPVDMHAIKTIMHSSVALDVYGWLAYRLHSLKQPKTIGWMALMSQFGIGYTRLRKFRERFTEALELALCVYPQGRVRLSAEGVTIFPSPPPLGEGRHLRLVTNLGQQELKLA
jgi:hypothetical protein